MDVVKIENVDDMGKYKEDWEELQKSDKQSTFYQSFEYSYIWCKHNLSREDELSIYAVYNNNKLVAIAPFFIEKRKKAFLSWMELKFIGMGDYRFILCDDSGVNRYTIYNLIMSTITELKSVDRILLSYIPDNNDFLNYLLSSEKYNSFTNYLTENPIINLHGKERIIPKKANKKRNKLKKDLNYRFDVKYSVSEELFEEFTNLHKTQQDFMKNKLDRKERRSHFNENKRNEFIKEVSKLDDSSLMFLIRDAEDELIFYRYCYSYKDKLYSWNSSYNYKYHNYNLSDVAILDMLDYLEKQEAFNLLDLGSGGYAWKFRWTKEFNLVYSFDYWKNKDTLAYKMFKMRG